MYIFRNIQKVLRKFVEDLMGRNLPFNPIYYKEFSFNDEQEFSLVIIGAHDGKKTKRLIKISRNLGKVLLVEPVPFLFDKLKKRYGKKKNILLSQLCVTDSAEGLVDFYAPTEKANLIKPFADQLGSLKQDHAKNHDPKLINEIKIIQVKTITITDLLTSFNCSSINLLLLDTEGYDTEILKSFPFDKIKPSAILFEHKHSDGTHNIGENFAATIVMLNQLGYRVRCIDRENSLATLLN